MHGLMMDYPLTIDRILEHGNRVYPHKRISTMLPDGSMHRYTYADLYRRVKKLVHALIKLDVQPGDRVATFAWNNYQHLELYYAIPGCGAVCHTLNIRLFPEQLAYVVNHAEDKVIFIDGTLLPAFERIADQVHCAKHYVLFNCERDVETKLTNVVFYDDLVDEADEDCEWVANDENAAMGLCYTSGTTGKPKGVLYSHRSMYLHTLYENQANALGVTERDVVLPVVPQFHAMAWGFPYACIMAGADMIMPGPHLQPVPLADLIIQERVTVPAGVPTIWSALFPELKARGKLLPHVRALVVGGSAMPQAMTEAYEKELGVNVLHAWGMTELSPLGTVCILQSCHDSAEPEAKWKVKAKQGYPVAGVEMRIMNDSGEEMRWDGVSMGEIQVRGACIAKEYYKLGRDSEHFTADGWFRTGDVGTVDEAGYMELSDRTKDLVKSGGEWISSVALENALMAHAKVSEAAVIAIPDEKWSERPLAVVVVDTDAGPVTSEELSSHLSSSFPKFWLPDRFVLVPEIPKTSVGKFDKKVLRQQYADGKL